jgi:hypothetical protein
MMSIYQNANGLGNKFLQHYIKPFPEINITEENTIKATMITFNMHINFKICILLLNSSFIHYNSVYNFDFDASIHPQVAILISL